MFFNSSLVTAGQCLAVWRRHWVVGAHCLAGMSPCRGAHMLVVKFRIFTDFSSAVVATCLLVTLVSNENRYSENHIFPSGVNYILPCFSTRRVRSG